jgi:hypothetical protein
LLFFAGALFTGVSCVVVLVGADFLGAGLADDDWVDEVLVDEDWAAADRVAKHPSCNIRQSIMKIRGMVCKFILLNRARIRWVCICPVAGGRWPVAGGRSLSMILCLNFTLPVVFLPMLYSAAYPFALSPRLR